jgi:hypothetical protein
MISEQKTNAPLPWLAGLTAFVWLVLVAGQIFLPAKPLAVEALPAPAPSVSN